MGEDVEERSEMAKAGIGRALRSRLPQLRLANCAVVVVSCAITSFGLFNVHSFSGITEGGLLGLTLLLDHWLGISPAASSFVLSVACYAVGWKLLGREFMGYSVIAMVAYSAFYALFEWWGPVWPQLAEMPLVACVVGALFVGVGAGLCVRAGGAQVGDDALAMSISSVAKIEIQWVYLAFDLVVLAVSLSYIPLTRIAYSLATVVLSGQIIGLIQKIPVPWGKDERKPL